jgi:hypothetical protein
MYMFKHHSVTCMHDYRWGLDRWLDLLTTYTHDPELQAVTVPPQFSAIHISPQHPLSLFPACCVFISCSLAMTLNSFTCSGPLFTYSRTVLPNNWLCALLITSQHGLHRKTPFPTVTLLLHVYLLPWECVCWVVAQKRLLFTESPLSNGSIHHNSI